MTAPVIRQYTGTIPDKGQAQTSFDTNVDGWLDWTTLQFAPDLVAFGTWADQVRAALIAGNLPPLTGRNLDAVRVNAAGNDVEFADVTAAGWALLDDANAAAQRTTLGLVIGTDVSAPIGNLTQLQAEDPASTVFGTVSGQRLAQANATPYGTLATTTSGTAFDFTGLPAGVNEISVVFNDVGLSGTNDLLVQLGTSSGIISAGYNSSSVTTGSAGSSASFSTEGLVARLATSARSADLIMTIKRQSEGGNIWVASHAGSVGAALSDQGGGRVTLAAELTQLRLTRTGSNTFATGTANISWRY